jgi:alpha-N-arabinofuranosidase
MRDALIQAVVLNIFNRHAEDLLLCSVSMSVNALSSVMLTRGEQMIKNPTFYVFRMFKGHQGAVLVHSFVDDESFEFDGEKLPCVSCSASVKDGKMLITLVNCTLDSDYEIDCSVLFKDYTKCEGEILHGGIRERNTFDEPDLLKSRPYNDFTLKGGGLCVKLPHCSVVALNLS